MYLLFGKNNLESNKDIIEILEKKNYKLYIFNGQTYVKTDKYTLEDYYIYVRPDISIKEK